MPYWHCHYAISMSFCGWYRSVNQTMWAASSWSGWQHDSLWDGLGMSRSGIASATARIVL